MAVIAVLGTLDSKGEEHTFVADLIRKRGHEVLLIDAGSGGEPQITPDFTRFDVAKSIGLDLQTLIARQDRGECVVAMSKALPVFVSQLVEEGKIDGIISLGGGGGTALGTSAMRALPVGFPKVMVSTLASGNTQHYVGSKDIVMIPSVVDVAGLNAISRKIFTRAAGAICGMVESETESDDSSKPVIVASMFGNTTDCINIAKEVLEEKGYEVLVFHATGIGGKTMESVIESGQVVGVLDVTTTELADELCGGVLSAGKERMDAMTKMNLPAVVAPGCVDMINFGARETLPEKYENRQIYIHNPQVTLVRTNAEECAELGRQVAEKANANKAPVLVMVPLKGVSIICQEGQSFFDEDADKALYSAIREHSEKEVLEYDTDINDPAFAKAERSESRNLRARPAWCCPRNG